MSSNNNPSPIKLQTDTATETGKIIRVEFPDKSVYSKMPHDTGMYTITHNSPGWQDGHNAMNVISAIEASLKEMSKNPESKGKDFKALEILDRKGGFVRYLNHSEAIQFVKKMKTHELAAEKSVAELVQITSEYNKSDKMMEEWEINRVKNYAKSHNLKLEWKNLDKDGNSNDLVISGGGVSNVVRNCKPDTKLQNTRN